jgi:hypothetical protein
MLKRQRRRGNIRLAAWRSDSEGGDPSMPSLKTSRGDSAGAGAGADDDGDGALTGPTISGCSFTAAASAPPVGVGGSSPASLEIRFNQTLLGGEGLMLRRTFDANETGGWGLQPGTKGFDPLEQPSVDSNGAMVCTVDPSCDQGR